MSHGRKLRRKAGESNIKRKGRPKGALNRATQAKQDYFTRLRASGILPLEVMLENMRFAHGEADRMLRALRRLADEAGEHPNQEMLGDMDRILKRVMALKEVSQGCARDAARFVHPQVSSIVYRDEEADDSVGSAQTGIRVEFVEPSRIPDTVTPPAEPEELQLPLLLARPD